MDVIDRRQTDSPFVAPQAENYPLRYLLWYAGTFTSNLIFIELRAIGGA
jgi:hypothetical protein